MPAFPLFLQKKGQIGAKKGAKKGAKGKYSFIDKG
jgi:hypothetical protein